MFLFFVVETEHASCAVPLVGEGAGELLARLQEFPDFNAAVIESMAAPATANSPAGNAATSGRKRPEFAAGSSESTRPKC